MSISEYEAFGVGEWPDLFSDAALGTPTADGIWTLPDEPQISQTIQDREAQEIEHERRPKAN